MTAFGIAPLLFLGIAFSAKPRGNCLLEGETKGSQKKTDYKVKPRLVLRGGQGIPPILGPIWRQAHLKVVRSDPMCNLRPPLRRILGEGWRLLRDLREGLGAPGRTLIWPRVKKMYAMSCSGKHGLKPVILSHSRFSIWPSGTYSSARIWRHEERTILWMHQTITFTSLVAVTTPLPQVFYLLWV